MTTPTLQLDDVTAGYGATTVLRNITLEVPPSSVVALLGPNGAGKTTLLRAACGIIPVRQGKVRFDGEDVTKRRMDEMASRGLCHVPEGRGIFPSLSVKENLVLFSPRRQEGTAVERAAGAFPILGQRLNQMAGSMSGGEQQMLAMARAYLSNPRLVLVDEASMGLAPLVVDKIFEFLARIVAGGTSLLLVEQYVYRALQMANTVYVLNHGKIAFSGSPAELEGDDIFERYLGVEAGIDI